MPLAGSTSHSTIVTLRDSTTGALKTGLAYNSAGAVASYCRPGSARVAISLITQTVTGAFSAGGFVEIDATNMPGKYRLDVPDTAFVSGASEVEVQVGFTGAAMDTCNLPITAYDPQDADALGLADLVYTKDALPPAPPGDPDGIITFGTGDGQLNPSTGKVRAGTVDDKTGYSLATAPPTAADIATAVAADVLATPAHKLATDADGKVTATNPGSAPTAEDNATAAAAAILVTPADKLATDSYGRVTTSNPGGGGATVEEIVDGLLLTPANKLFTDEGGYVGIATPLSPEMLLEIATAIWDATTRTLTTTSYEPPSTVEIVDAIMGAMLGFAGGVDKTVRDALQAAWVQARGKWVDNAEALTSTEYEPDKETPWVVFDIDNAEAPTQRTPQT